jgi:carbon storage regulator
MLVLSRKHGQSLVIDGGTVIRVLEIRGNQVRLGVEAPANVAVLRSELKQQPDGSAALPSAFTR